MIGAAVAACLLVAALLPGSAFSAAGHAGASATTITVTLGQPSASKLELSPKKAVAGALVFKVRNGGKVSYRFKVCAHPAASAKATSCTGKTTKLLAPGQSSSLSVTLAAKGTYEYLSTTSSAAAGAKGLISITAKPRSTTKPPSGGADVALGKALFTAKGCGSCHTLAAAHAAGGIGPNLDQLAPSQAAVARQVTSGGSQMPAFGSVLTKAQINDIAAFVYGATHK